MAELRILLLGAPRIERDGVAVEFDTRKATALLAYLGVTGQFHQRDTIAALLWPEYDSERSRGALRRTLSTVRSALDDRWLAVARNTVGLDADGLWVDVREFRRLLAEARDREPGALAALGAAAGLYRGDFLAGFALRDSAEFDEWQSFQAEGLRRDLGEALGRLVSGHIARGELSAAIGHARRLVGLDPLNEPAHRSLMQLYAWTGNRSAAIRQYRECERLLDRELGVAPLQETRALHEAIRTGSFAARTTSDRDAVARYERMARETPDAVAVHVAVGDLHTLHGDYGKAITSYEAALARADGATRAVIEHKLADVYHRRGSWDPAEQHYRAALVADDPGWSARVYADWSLAAHRRGEVERARALAAEATALAERARDARALAQAENILGVLAGGRGDHDAAKRHLERSLAHAETLADPTVRVAALNNLALACGRSGEGSRAIALTEAALELAARVGDRHREAALHNNLSDLLRQAGRREEAKRHLTRAVTLFAEIGEPGVMEPEVWKLVEW